MALQGDEPELQLGSTGEHVEQLQDRLRGMGVYTEQPSGTFDDGTEQALREAQSQLGLEMHGRVDQQTWEYLDQHMVERGLEYNSYAGAGNQMWDQPGFGQSAEDPWGGGQGAAAGAGADQWGTGDQWGGQTDWSQQGQQWDPGLDQSQGSWGQGGADPAWGDQGQGAWTQGGADPAWGDQGQGAWTQGGADPAWGDQGQGAWTQGGADPAWGDQGQGAWTQGAVEPAWTEHGQGHAQGAPHGAAAPGGEAAGTPEAAEQPVIPHPDHIHPNIANDDRFSSFTDFLRDQHGVSQ